ncbi:hypothetical protein TREMEDRAFT_61180 [Tremella mesenterica DSM 1558]|uniref:uncharacterized protein n=1 Tax=Tremella mesenterica (strain ATCC 24925 / CBS 8224 / DSM 1558 / NBRC 9311 / NRRL Y-6157 / RJB 2259-6 / UBC 559-6) TaxID=578456 RepID=UPI0003F4971E|nr:uncharacterized protein TREMEDRAFT_61180 [Tremella mesenterica DSM 1558]EIW70672.1 hypothetical protein TREMEDRAFT_61180 [Tremella mesenterica DSM 1558]
METPDIRSRRKRRLGDSTSSQEDGRVAWSHDQRLRKAVLLATEDDIPPLPTPTQKPRPISSLLSSSSKSTPSLSSAKPRKRPCRAHRSLPALRAPHTPSVGGSLPGSVEVPTQESVKEAQERLDALLGEAMAKFALQPSSNASHRIATRTTPRRSAKKSSSLGTTLSMDLDRENRPNIRHTTGSRIPLSSNKTTQTVTNPPPLPVPNKEVKMSTKSISISRTPLSPIKNGAPRVGLTRTHLDTKQHNLMTKPFKSPLPTQQPLRSSPRRTAAAQAISSIPARGSPLRPCLSTRVSANKSIHPVQEQRTSGRQLSSKLHNANVDVGEDEPAGDKSYDSIDGMFEEGGLEVEELLKAVDGSG